MTGFIDREIQKLDPIPVMVVRNPEQEVEEEAADFASWQSFLYVTGAEGPQRILPQANTRKKAIININNGFFNNNNAGYVIVGTRAQCMNPGTQGSVGGIYVSGNVITVESKGEVWVVGDGA